MDNQPKQIRPLLPFYLVVDVSYSMAGARLDAVNRICPEVASEVAISPILRDKTRFGVVTFSDQASVVLPLSDLGAVTQLPVFAPEGGTSFRAALTLLKKTIQADVDTLRQDDGFKIHRPAVFFVTDGEPLSDSESDWKAAFESLTDAETFPYRPNIIPFGVEEADVATIEFLAHPKPKFTGYFQSDGADVADVIKKIAEIILSSVLSSAASVGAGTDPTDALVNALNDAVADSDVLTPVGDYLN